MNNQCVFSPDRVFRYVLRCSWEPLFEPKKCMFIGLNPSTADENDLDPTLRRIQGFCRQWGYNGFIMTNIFAFRATLPDNMKSAADPIGPENDLWLRRSAGECDLIVACWGTHGTFMRRDESVLRLLADRQLHSLHLTDDGHPGHPLYLPKSARPQPYPPAIAPC